MRDTHEVIWRKKIEPCRIVNGPHGSDASIGRYGAFIFREKSLRVICSEGEGWDHVSVSRDDRIPTWEEMQWVKELFFKDSEAVMQVHPRSLHMWRPNDGREIPLPPSFLVGNKELGVLE